jgi:ATP adenylyltransferase
MGATEKSKGPPTPGSGSFLLDYWRDPANDKSNLIIHRDGQGLILLNRYPYANGHLLVALGDARPTLLDYDPSQRAHLWRLTERATDLMHRTLEPQGINIGINQGRAAGAGVPQHLHVHLVPRWGGDVNFMTVVGQIRVIPSSLEAMWARFVAMAERSA